MRRVIMVAFVFLTLAACAGLQQGGSLGSAQEGPRLEKIWAPAEFNYGELLKIYIKASDPSGDMKFLLVTGGGGGITQPVGFAIIRLKKNFGKDLNGYVYWDSKRAVVKEGSATIEVQAEDRRGNESEVQSVNVKMVPQGAKAEKPPADFQEVEIGPLEIYNVRKVTP